MKIAYYPDTDSMYIDLRAKSSTESKEGEQIGSKQLASYRLKAEG